MSAETTPRGLPVRARVAALLALATACASDPYKPRVREFDPGAYPEAAAPTRGSLFGASTRGFAEDVRPREVGEVLVIRIDESDSASHEASSALSRDGKQSYGLGGALEKLAPSAGLDELFSSNAESSFDGRGAVRKRGAVQGTLPVRVRRVLPGGDLYVEGTKTVVISNEQRHLYISGIVRAFDVRADGSVSSARVADAEIEYVTEGDATDQERPGWLTRVLTTIWPF
jgi:flagellar L-ring protein precursor FlgH